MFWFSNTGQVLQASEFSPGSQRRQCTLQQITAYLEQQVTSYLQDDALDGIVPSSPNTATEKTPEAEDVSPGTDFTVSL